MKTKARFSLVLTLLLLPGLALIAVSGAAPAQGGAPTVVAYQGEVRLGGTPHSGLGYFKFAVVNAAGTTTYWSNDGTSSGEPTNPIKLEVSDGLFSVLLGDIDLDNMTQPMTADVFEQPDRTLRVWFSTSDSGPFDLLVPDTRIAAVPYALQAQEAANADTVDGLHAGELGGTHYQNVIVAAPCGGANTTVPGAIDSVTGASADNPYLVWVAPGLYVEQVTLVPHVHLQGAGQEATIIRSTTTGGTWPPGQATLHLASDTSVRDLTVRNLATGDHNAAVLATAGTTRTLLADVTVRTQGAGIESNSALFLFGTGIDVTLQQVTALGENCSGGNYGLVIYLGPAVTLRGGSFTARGGDVAKAIINTGNDSILVAERVTTLGENGSNSSIGLHSSVGAATTLRGGSFTGRGGEYVSGIRSEGSDTTLEAESVTALGENGTYNYGLFHSTGAAATLCGGSFTGRGGTGAFGIYNAGNGTMLETTGVTALGENGSWNYGLHNASSAAATLSGGSFTARGGLDARAINNYIDTTLDIGNVTALAEDGTANYGLYNEGATARADSSQFSGDSDKALYQDGGTVRLGVCQLDDGHTLTGGGALTCFQVYDGGYAAYSCP
jgi:hypothetical protein